MEIIDDHLLDFTKSNKISIPKWFINKEPYSLVIGEDDTPKLKNKLDNNIDIFICYPYYSESYIDFLKSNIALINGDTKYKHKHLICILDLDNLKQCEDFIELFKNKFNKIILDYHVYKQFKLDHISLLLVDSGNYTINNGDTYPIENYNQFMKALDQDIRTFIEINSPFTIDYLKYQQRSINRSMVDDNLKDILDKSDYLLSVLLHDKYDFKINIDHNILDRITNMEDIGDKFINLINIFGCLLLNFHQILGDLIGHIELNEYSKIHIRYQKINLITNQHYKNKCRKYKLKYLKLKNSLNYFNK